MKQPRRIRLVAGGGVLAALYLLVASITLDAAHPVRPLFDGSHLPTPFRFVNPPTPDPSVPAPEGTVARLTFTERSIDGEKQRFLDGRVVTTGDGQASMSIPSGAIPYVEGATGVRFEITPLDPATVGDEPEGVDYDGNAVRMEAFYEPSGEPATFSPQDCSLGGCLTVIIRYPHAGTELWLRDGAEWRTVPDITPFPSTFTIAAPVLELGTFVVTKIPGTGPGGTGSNLSMIIAFVAGGLAVAGAVFLQWRRARTVRARAKRSSSAKPSGRHRAADKAKSSATRKRSRR